MNQNIGEKHHIKPKSLFPDLAKDQTNIIKLTYREHYICHWLLIKIYEEIGDKNAMYKMASAWVLMCKNNDGIHVTSQEYELARQKWSEVQKGKAISKEHKQKLSFAFKGKHHTEEAKIKMSESRKGKTFFKGKHHTEEAKIKMSESHKGRIPWNKGKHHTEEAKIKMAAAKKGSTYTKSLLWYNNGIINTRAKECPGEGWVRGRLKK